MTQQTKLILVAIIVVYSAVWIAVGLITGAMATARGKVRRDTDPRRFWLHLGVRAAMGAAALGIYFSGV
jgi:hypothetical protein